jgi:hypothetical protein
MAATARFQQGRTTMVLSPQRRLWRPMVVVVLGVALSGCLFVRIRPLGGEKRFRQSDLPAVVKIDGDRIRTLARPDAIPSIDQPQFVTAAEADFMDEAEMILGVVHDGVAKAYSLWHLDRHEIVNDWIGKDAVAVTW